MVIKYYRSYLLIAVLFTVVTYISAENMFFMFYPCMICGMIPGNLLAYDENSRWLLFSGTLPITKRQFVSAKYLVGLSAQLVTLLIVAIAQAARMVRDHCFDGGDYAILLILTMAFSLPAPSFSLPFMFRWGVERGRVAYYIMVGAVCAGAFICAKNLPELQTSEIQPAGLLLGICAAGIGIYVLSWMLSIRFFEKRELG